MQLRTTMNPALRGGQGSDDADCVVPVTVAWSAWQKLRGLIGRPPPPAGTGLLIPRCRAIHMLGMSYPIDVVFLDPAMRALSVRTRVRPWQLYVGQRHARHTLEMAAGEAAAADIQPGVRLSLLVGEPNSSEPRKGGKVPATRVGAGRLRMLFFSL